MTMKDKITNILWVAHCNNDPLDETADRIIAALPDMIKPPVFKFNHRPVLDIDWLENHYSKLDGVPVKYVCTSSKVDSVQYGDIFYRETPHPEFGNKYFMVYTDYTCFPTGLPVVLIQGADWIENEIFSMFEHDGVYYYSRGRHDYVTEGDKMIDGGRAYVRFKAHPVYTFNVKDGELVKFWHPST
jgi:hypothetical protein